MAVLYGAKLFRSSGNEARYESDVFGKNSEAFTAGDLVGLTSGLLTVQTSAIIGVIAKTATMTATNQTVAKVSPLYIPIYQDDIFLMGCDSDLTGNATNAGTYYTVGGATGAQQVNVADGVSTTTFRTVEIVEVDPRGLGGTGSGSGLRECLVRILKTPYTNIAAT